MDENNMQKHIKRNRAWWNEISDQYQRRHRDQLIENQAAWGVWSIPETRLNVLGNVAGKDILELGCGAAQWSIALARLGARPVALDLSERQLEHGRRLMDEMGIHFPLIQANGEQVPIIDESFDIVFCDYGAMLFGKPELTVAEAARLLRPGGLFAFNTTTPLLFMCWPENETQPGDKLYLDYFDLRTINDGGVTRFQLPYGEWIRLFTRMGFIVEDLIELRPDEQSASSFGPPNARDWARRWPAEHIWKARKVEKFNFKSKVFKSATRLFKR